MMLRAVLLGFAAVLALPVQAQSIRIKDLVEFDGVRVDSLLAQFLGSLLRFLRAARSQQNGDALLPELARGFESDAFVGAGD